MDIGGFQKLTLIDYPGKVACIIFTIGCNLRCPFCHVPQLVLPEKTRKVKRIPEKIIFEYLEKNKNLLDGVVITGGEPTIQKDLVEFIKRIKNMGLAVAIETNGTNPKVIKNLIEKNLVDYVSMDIKNVFDFEKYKKTTGILDKQLLDNIKKSIQILKSVDHEFRTTIVKGIHDMDDIKNLVQIMKYDNYYLQQFKDNEILENNAKFQPFLKEEIKDIIGNIKYRE